MAFARAGHHDSPDRLADQITAALTSEIFTARDYLVQAHAATIRLTGTGLLAIGGRRRAWEKRMSHLLLDAPRSRRVRPRPTWRIRRGRRSRAARST